jgi:hypothetical protein
MRGKHANALVIQVLNNNRTVKEGVASVVSKTSQNASKVKSEGVNLGTSVFPLQDLEYWKETDAWYPVLMNSGSTKGRLRLQACLIPGKAALGLSDNVQQTARELFEKTQEQDEDEIRLPPLLVD